MTILGGFVSQITEVDKIALKGYAVCDEPRPSLPPGAIVARRTEAGRGFSVCWQSHTYIVGVRHSHASALSESFNSRRSIAPTHRAAISHQHYPWRYRKDDANWYVLKKTGRSSLSRSSRRQEAPCSSRPYGSDHQEGPMLFPPAIRPKLLPVRRTPSRPEYSKFWRKARRARLSTRRGGR